MVAVAAVMVVVVVVALLGVAVVVLETLQVSYIRKLAVFVLHVGRY